jgi:pilus assembly protein CpaB
MRIVFALVLLVGVGLAGFAVMMAKDRFDQYQTVVAKQQQKIAAAVDVVEVYVMATAIHYGEKIDKDDVRKVRWPADAVPSGAFRTEEELFPDADGRLRTATRAMEANEPVLAVKVTEPGQDAGVSSRLGKGMRAFAISVNVTSGVSGFLRPGDRVDVYWSGSSQSQDVTKLIQSSMRIIGIDQNADMDRTAPTIARTITVEATPQQVAGLAQAQRTGTLSLSLVGAADDAFVGNIEIDQNELLGIVEDEEVIERAEVKEVCTIRTRRGSEVVEIPIPCTN